MDKTFRIASGGIGLPRLRRLGPLESSASVVKPRSGSPDVKSKSLTNLCRFLWLSSPNIEDESKKTPRYHNSGTGGPFSVVSDFKSKRAETSFL
jgi:hypothetical protein